MRERDPEASAIYIVLLLITVPVVVVTYEESHTIAGGAALALVLGILALFGLITQPRGSHDFPRATARRSKSRRKR